MNNRKISILLSTSTIPLVGSDHWRRWTSSTLHECNTFLLAPLRFNVSQELDINDHSHAPALDRHRPTYPQSHPRPNIPILISPSIRSPSLYTHPTPQSTRAPSRTLPYAGPVILCGRSSCYTVSCIFVRAKCNHPTSRS